MSRLHIFPHVFPNSAMWFIAARLRHASKSIILNFGNPLAGASQSKRRVRPSVGLQKESRSAGRPSRGASTRKKAFASPVRSKSASSMASSKNIFFILICVFSAALPSGCSCRPVNSQLPSRAYFHHARPHVPEVCSSVLSLTSVFCSKKNDSALLLGSRASRRLNAGPQTPARRLPSPSTREYSEKLRMLYRCQYQLLHKRPCEGVVGGKKHVKRRQGQQGRRGRVDGG